MHGAGTKSSLLRIFHIAAATALSEIGIIQTVTVQKCCDKESECRNHLQNIRTPIANSNFVQVVQMGGV
jgi:hypothetical protein